MGNNKLSSQDEIMRTAMPVGDALQSTALQLTDDDDHGMLWIRGQVMPCLHYILTLPPIIAPALFPQSNWSFTSFL